MSGRVEPKPKRRVCHNHDVIIIRMAFSHKHTPIDTLLNTRSLTYCCIYLSHRIRHVPGGVRWVFGIQRRPAGGAIGQARTDARRSIETGGGGIHGIRKHIQRPRLEFQEQNMTYSYSDTAIQQKSKEYFCSE